MKKLTILSLFVLCLTTIQSFAQQPDIQYYRPLSKEGINVFEASKSMDQPEFTGVKVRIGGAFTQNYQNFTSTNESVYVKVSSTNTKNKNLLYGYVSDPKASNYDTTQATLSGFNLAQANLNFDVQLADGIRVCLENYMSARHHNEFWVKGGYVQIDKLPMFGSPEWFTKYVRVKIGHFQPNFGDMQFRRGDGGNTFYNPFGENLIVDAFATEIGGEVYLFPLDGFMVMAGMNSGFINGNITKYADTENSVGVAVKKSPSIYAKAAFDKNFSDDFRFRLSASIYNNSNSQRNTLLSGDRTGSQYFGVMEPALVNGLPPSLGTSPSDPTKNSGPNFTSGRMNPSMANRITAISVNPFIKFHGLELFAGYDIFSGGTYADTIAGEGSWNRRSWSQISAELVFRFFPNEQAYVGARYVNATGEMQGFVDANGDFLKVGSNRLAFAAGWFPTKNLLLKGEYVIQNYTGFPNTDYRYNGKFTGFMISAAIGF